jgi:hypothetical protein
MMDDLLQLFIAIGLLWFGTRYGTVQPTEVGFSGNRPNYGKQIFDWGLIAKVSEQRNLAVWKRALDRGVDHLSMMLILAQNRIRQMT